MTGPVHFCWSCYAQLPDLPATCPHCGGPTEPSPTATTLELQRWALGHPLIERRMIALTALERNPAAAAEPAVIETVRALLDAADPYLAAQALHTVHTLLGDDARELVQRAAREGPAPVRHVARTLLKTTPSRGNRTPRGGTIPVTRINPGMIPPPARP